MNIERIAELFDTIPPASKGLWSVEQLSEGRLYLTKSDDNRPALILEGERESFGALPPLSVIQHSDDVTALPGGRKLKALRITSAADTNSDRVLAHIAYEFAWRLGRSPAPTNEELLKSLGWMFTLLGERRSPMSDERQVGLIGETLFMRRLLQRAHGRNVDVGHALACWAGADKAKRDFYAHGTVVEAKATGHVARLHHIGSLDQLTVQEPGEQVFLFSLGIRQDQTAPKKLTHFVADIEALLVDGHGGRHESAIEEFRQRLSTYGFDWADRDLYERQAGFLAPHLPPELFPVSELRHLTLEDFVDMKVPETVRAISYLLEVVGTPLCQDDLLRVCDRLLGIGDAPPV